MSYITPYPIIVFFFIWNVLHHITMLMLILLMAIAMVAPTVFDTNWDMTS